MPRKDPEERKEYQREWENRNKEKRSEYRIEWRKEHPNYHIEHRKKHPNVKRHDSHYDFETHRELAMNSGIQNQREWFECSKRGLLPDGIYSHPDQSFRNSSKEKAL